MSIRIRYSGLATPGVLKRERPKAMKVAFGVIGILWHRLLRKKHFTQKGAREYGYQRRDGEDLSRQSKRFRSSYTGRKLKKFGHTRPLEYTGATKILSKLRNVKATSKGVRVLLRTPALNFAKLRDGSSPADEMKTVSQGEVRFLIKRFRNELMRQFGKIRARKTVKVS